MTSFSFPLVVKGRIWAVNAEAEGENQKIQWKYCLWSNWGPQMLIKHMVGCVQGTGDAALHKGDEVLPFWLVVGGRP